MIEGTPVHPAVTLYTSSWCGWCHRAKTVLQMYGATWTEIDVDELPGGRDELYARTGRSTVPQIFIGDRHVGGYDDLVVLERQGKLASMLAL